MIAPSLIEVFSCTQSEPPYLFSQFFEQKREREREREFKRPKRKRKKDYTIILFCDKIRIYLY